MSIYSQAMFWARNVCDADTAALRDAVPGHILPGLIRFSKLMREMFTDYASYEISKAENVRTKIGIMADDLENYHNLTDTADCLYKIALTGVPQRGGLLTEKAAFKAAFKKTATFPFTMLEKYGVAFTYTKAGKPVSAYKSCDSFHLTFPETPSLPEAMHILAHAPGCTQTRFFLTDYEAAVLADSGSRGVTSPLRAGIGRTAGEREHLWITLVEALTGAYPFHTDITINPYVFPNWTVKFLDGKRTVAIFHIGTDYINARVPTSVRLAKELIDTRSDLPQSIRGCIGSFGCVSCGKCKDHENIVFYDGIDLCTLTTVNFITEDSRAIRIPVTTAAEAEAVASIAIRSLADPPKSKR